MTAAPVESDVLTSVFEAFLAARPADEAPWVGDVRRAGMSRFRELGFPTTRQEEWRTTSVTPIARTPFRLPTQDDAAGVATDREVDAFTFGRGFEGSRIVFVNGRHAPELSSVRDVAGVEISPLSETLAGDTAAVESNLGRAGAFEALNAAFLEDGALLVVAEGTVVEQPIHVVYLSSCAGEPVMSHPRTVIALERGAQARVVESYGGLAGGRYWTNAVTDVLLGDGAVLDHTKVQREREDAYHVGLMRVRQGRDTSFTAHSLALGGGLVRNDVDLVFMAEGGECSLDGLFMADGNRHTDTHTLVDHAVPRCTSRELYKGILDGEARGVFHGKVLVRPGAQKTDAQQYNKNLLLSRKALVHSTPALEILADDVKCRHGSTTGQLDPLQLFYLRSRGIGEAEARGLLTHAFASDVVSRLKVDEIRAGLAEHLQSRLGAADIREAVV